MQKLFSVDKYQLLLIKLVAQYRKSLKEAINEFTSFFYILQFAWSADFNLSFFSRCLVVYVLLTHIFVFCIVFCVIPVVVLDTLKVRYGVLYSISAISFIRQLLGVSQSSPSNILGLGLYSSSILQFVRARKTVFKAVKSPLSFVSCLLVTVHLCLFWILSIFFFLFFNNPVSKVVWAPLATSMFYLFDKGYLFLPAFYAITLLYFVCIYLICKQYPSCATFLYDTFTHAFVSHFIGNSPAKEAMEIVPKFLVCAVIAAATSLGFYAGYTVFDHEYSRRSVQDAIELSQRPGSPSAERIIALQIKVRESFHLSTILRPYLEALSESSSSVSKKKLELELKKIESDNAVLLERLRNKRLSQEHNNDQVIVKHETGSQNDTISSIEVPDLVESIALFPLSKKNFNSVVWGILKRVHGEEFLEQLEDKPESSEKSEGSKTLKRDTK